ncbi:hypothetical protein C8F01DRAFT_560415 [Mycena amicta]|nr:hypothetical protein C8F01DRAFT_560415 [Mycena amicta]
MAPTGKICFDVYAGTYMTLGLALPPAHSQFRDEMMVFSSFPLPYGYVGAVPGVFQLQDSDSDSPADATGASPGPPLQILTFWVDRMKLPRRDSYPPGSETLIAESAIRKPGTNGADTLFPLALTTIKTSPIVSGNSTHAIHIFRCLQCAFLTDHFASARSPVVNMSMIYSRSAPQPVGGMGLAVLPLASSETETETFQVVVKQAQFEEYEEMLKTARLI